MREIEILKDALQGTSYLQYVKKIEFALAALRSRVAELEAEAVVYSDIKAERVRQDEKWGEQNHEPAIWLAILGEEFGEVASAVIAMNCGKDKQRPADYRTELVQTAAVCVNAIECFGRAAGLLPEEAQS